jgi:hypothetical protein
MAPSIAQAIAHRVADAESRNRAGEFIKLAQLVATRGTDLWMMSSSTARPIAFSACSRPSSRPWA